MLLKQIRSRDGNHDKISSASAGSERPKNKGRKCHKINGTRLQSEGTYSYSFKGLMIKVK